MDLIQNWQQVKDLFRQSFKTSFHYSIASVTGKGEPHVTPIGSLILGKPGQAIYFEEFPSQLPKNYQSNPHICVLAVNSGRWYWFRALFKGKFSTPPAVRLYGKAGNLRNANVEEIELWQKRVRAVGFTKGHKIIWTGMKKVREIEFSRIEPVLLGPMTKESWKEHSY